MSIEDDESKSSESRATRGLRRLMLRLPVLRDRLQILHRQPGPLIGFCEAYEDASVMYFNLLRKGDHADPRMVREYRQICDEIEDEVRGYCAAHHPNASI